MEAGSFPFLSLADEFSKGICSYKRRVFILANEGFPVFGWVSRPQTNPSKSFSLDYIFKGPLIECKSHHMGAGAGSRSTGAGTPPALPSPRLCVRVFIPAGPHVDARRGQGSRSPP